MKNTRTRLAAQWKQFSGEAKKEWGQLTDDELLQINGDREILVGILQARYSLAKQEVNKQVGIWIAKLKVSDKSE